MITVVSENNVAAVADPFPGMSLAEVCANMETATVEALSEMNMSILLKEHAYLHENGVEITYVNEKGEATEDGMKVRERISATISHIADVISDTWDKLIAWVSDHINQAIEAFAKAGLSKKKLPNVIAAYYEDHDVLPVNLTKEVAYDEFQNGYAKWFNTSKNGSDTENGPTKETIYDKYVKTVDGVNFKRADMEAASAVVFGTSMVKEIREHKKKAMDTLRDAKKEAKRSGDDGVVIERINRAMRENSAVTRGSVKVYHTHLTNCITALRTIMRTPEGKAISKEMAKQAVKDAPGNAKDAVVRGAKVAKQKGSDTLSDVKSKLARHRKDHRLPAHEGEAEVQEAADLYDGNFFKI